MADSKVADLTATTSPADSDILYIVTTPGGTPADKKVTVATLRTLSNSSNYVAADVTMTTAGTYYDGPSLSLAAGTWLLVGAVQILAVTNAARTFQAKLWDGTTTISNAVWQVDGTAAAGQGTLALSAIVAPGSTTTYKISATSSVNADTLRGTSTKGSYLNAVRIG